MPRCRDATVTRRQREACQGKADSYPSTHRDASPATLQISSPRRAATGHDLPEQTRYIRGHTSESAERGDKEQQQRRSSKSARPSVEPHESPPSRRRSPSRGKENRRPYTFVLHGSSASGNRSRHSHESFSLVNDTRFFFFFFKIFLDRDFSRRSASLFGQTFDKKENHRNDCLG